jgi:hypothetical protein
MPQSGCGLPPPCDNDEKTFLRLSNTFWIIARGKWEEHTGGITRNIAGQVSQEMLEHYSHIRLDAKRTALDALSQRGGTAVMSQTTSQRSLKPLTRVRKWLIYLVDETGVEPATSSSLRTMRN